MSARHLNKPHKETVPSQAAFLKMCEKRGINPEGQFAEEDGYLFFDGYEAGVRDTHRLCDVDKLVQLEHHVVAVLQAAIKRERDMSDMLAGQPDAVIAKLLPESLGKLWELVYGPA